MELLVTAEKTLIEKEVCVRLITPEERRDSSWAGKRDWSSRMTVVLDGSKFEGKEGPRIGQSSVGRAWVDERRKKERKGRRSVMRRNIFGSLQESVQRTRAARCDAEEARVIRSYSTQYISQRNTIRYIYLYTPTNNSMP